jgi:hypothetical protein
MLLVAASAGLANTIKSEAAKKLFHGIECSTNLAKSRKDRNTRAWHQERKRAWEARKWPERRFLLEPGDANEQSKLERR